MNFFVKRNSMQNESAHLLAQLFPEELFKYFSISQHELLCSLETKQERFDLALKMIAVLRLLMPDINIAAATALQAIDPAGREKALTIGANILMPNLTPCIYRKEYQLYEGKPCLDEDAELCKNCLEARIEISGCEVGYGEWGDSKHYLKQI